MTATLEAISTAIASSSPPLPPSSPKNATVTFRGRLVHTITLPKIQESGELFAERTSKVTVLIKPWLFEKEVSTFYPDAHGNFHFIVNQDLFAKYTSTTDYTTLFFKISKPQLPTSNRGGPPWQYVEVERFEKKTPWTDSEYDLGDLSLQYDQQYLEIDKIPAPTADQTPGFSYIKEFISVVSRTVAPELLKEAFSEIFSFTMSPSTIDKIWNAIQKKYLPIPLTWETLMEGLLNEVMAVTPSQNPSTGYLVWTANFDGLDFDKDDDNSLANATLYAKPSLDGTTPQPETLVLDFRKDNNTIATERVIIHRNSHPEMIKWAIYLAKEAFCTAGEATQHLRTHLQLGTIAWSFFKTVPIQHPLFCYLESALDQVAFINKLGSHDLIFGPGSVLAAGSLSPDGLNALLQKGITDTGDWTAFKPREPLCSSHYVAKGDLAVHKGFTALFTKIIDLLWPILKVEDQWIALYDWSRLINYYYPACPSFIHGESYPADGDKERLSKFCSWIFSIIYWHYAMHSSQQALTNAESATLGARDQALDYKGEFVANGNTTPTTMRRVESISRALMAFQGLTLLDSDVQDVHPEIVAGFQQIIDEEPDEKVKEFLKNMFKNIPI